MIGSPNIPSENGIPRSVAQHQVDKLKKGNEMHIEKRYVDGSYLEANPEWDRMDSEWKAKQVEKILKRNMLVPRSIVEVGCGSGDILRYLRRIFHDTKLVGYDISPQAQAFWQDDAQDIEFYLEDFHQQNTTKYDVLLMLDVFEHVRDPFSFLEQTRSHADFFVFHIPLDLSAQSVLRGHPLLNARRKVGHLHSYTKELALETLTDCGYQIIQWSYTGASISMPNRSLKTKLANIPRLLISTINKDFSVRVFGGETLIVLAK